MWRVPVDVAGLALVGLAHVDHLQGRLLGEPLGDPPGIDLDLGSLVGAAHVHEPSDRGRRDGRPVAGVGRLSGREVRGRSHH